MSQLSAHHGGAHAADHHDHGHHGVDPAVALRPENTTAAPGWGRGFSMAMFVVGLLCLLATAAFPFLGEGEKALKHAAASYHVGAVLVLGLALGQLGLLMIMILVRAGWVVTLRRQIENIASLVPVGLVLLLPIVALEIVKPGALFAWNKPGAAAADAVLAAKQAYFHPLFVLARLGFYAVLWIGLSRLLVGYSRRQDETGDPQLTLRAGYNSAWGILAYAISVAFASFDLLMALDFHWFSTMFGVYFFAGNMIGSLALLALVLVALRRSGRLEGLVTEEHFHDLGKLCMAFTIFWAYIAFSQYFLYWYANIPEETAWVNIRTNNGWENFGRVLIVGHFALPFLFFLWRGSKRTTTLLAAGAALLFVMHAVDLFWIVRPGVYYSTPSAGPADIIPGKLGLSWVDLTGVLGPICIFLGVLARRIASQPLVPLRDPRLHESLDHKNYV